MLTEQLISFIPIGLIAAISAFGICIAQSLTSSGFMQSSHRQPTASKNITKILLLGSFSIELPFILSIIIAFMLFIRLQENLSNATIIAAFGISTIMAICSVTVCLAIGAAVKEACNALAKHPKQERSLLIFVMIILTLIEAPMLFTFVITLLGVLQINHTFAVIDAWKITAALLSIASGTIGASITQILLTKSLFKNLYFRQDFIPRIQSLIFVVSGLLETCVLFTFLIALFLLLTKTSASTSSLGLCAAAICVGIGSIGASLGIGIVGKSAIDNVTKVDLQPNLFLKNMLPILFFVEASGLTSFIISLLLISRI